MLIKKSSFEEQNEPLVEMKLGAGKGFVQENKAK